MLKIYVNFNSQHVLTLMGNAVAYKIYVKIISYHWKKGIHENTRKFVKNFNHMWHIETWAPTSVSSLSFGSFDFAAKFIETAICDGLIRV